MLVLTNKDFRKVIRSVFCMFKKLTRDIKDVKKTKIELLTMKNTIFEMKTAISKKKNVLEGIKSRLDIDKEISEL